MKFDDIRGVGAKKGLSIFVFMGFHIIDQFVDAFWTMLNYIEASISLLVSQSIQRVNVAVIKVGDGAIIEAQVKIEAEVEVFLWETQFDTMAKLI